MCRSMSVRVVHSCGLTSPSRSRRVDGVADAVRFRGRRHSDTLVASGRPLRCATVRHVSRGAGNSSHNS